MSIKQETDEPYIQLICNPYKTPYSDSVKTRITIDVMQQDLLRDDLIELFETFAKSIGFPFGANERIDIVYEETPEQ
jgi:hypothetical protein